jgi:ElaB/YqjD/DUF883 family membrane-anchored ribosome-binding protein
VEVELSPYDLTKARIIFREKKEASPHEPFVTPQNRVIPISAPIPSIPLITRELEFSPERLPKNGTRRYWKKPTGERFMAEDNKTSTGTGDAQSKLESSKTHARKAAEDLKSAAGAVAGEYRGKAEEAWEGARGKAEQAWDDARSRARTFQEDAEEYVRENPTKAVFTALGIGFVLGLIFRR